MPVMPAFMYTPLWMVVFPILIVWSLVWKGFALWRAARNNSLAWFIVMLIINTLGILEIIYIFAFSKKTNEPSQG